MGLDRKGETIVCRSSAVSYSVLCCIVSGEKAFAG